MENIIKEATIELKVPFTHNMAADVMECFEDLLDEHGITIPSEDRDGDEGEARLYGMAYANLMDQVEEIIVDALKEAGVDHVPYRFR
ncbi:MAG: hypothetical protein IJ794_11340 [Lachnospiraceae bacterium]|nr:hypothetical protein [Lachnospiraceae bacterium]